MHPVNASAAKKKRTIRVSEVFYSIEGEGPFTGLPTLFVRTFGCNFTCSGFGNPSENKVIPIKIDKLDDFVPTVGCDSIYSWHPSYKHLTTTYATDELASKILSLLPGGTAKNPNSGESPVLSFTGGEPTLHQRGIMELLKEPAMKDFDKILIETNCAVNLSEDFIQFLTEWQAQPGDERIIMWANSPKLKVSGEIEADAIRPDILAAQMRVTGTIHYMKFVSDGSRESFDEIKRVVEIFRNGLPTTHHHLMNRCIYVMPMGATLDEQKATQQKVALLCMEYGYTFCGRVHVSVFDNAIGT